MERKLATIRKVSEIRPIKDADKIELAKVDGWQCVVRKGEFNEGDRGIYFEIDSFLPIYPIYEFLRKGCYKKLSDGTEGFRLKTIRLRKQLSQGLLLPLSLYNDNPLNDLNVGTDVTEMLHIKKYEPPVPAHLSRTVKGLFPPNLIQKTDQERIQNLPEYFEDYKDVVFEETEKLNGFSVTYYYNEGEFGACSRNLELKEDENNTIWKVAKTTDIQPILSNLKQDVALQGEMAGEGIQKNPLKLIGQQFFLFDIYDIQKKRYMTPDERKAFYADNLDNGKIKHIPILDHEIKIFQIADTMEKALEYAKGKMKENPEKEREGVIFKSHTIHNGNTISFKIINNDYLLKEEK